VIGANSVVTQDLPPRRIAAGVPARVIRRIEYSEADDAVVAPEATDVGAG
jgi:acetyltransferase-like isoleucine patch superfamily enzyme